MSEQVKNVKLNEDKPKETKSEETLDEGPPKYTKSVLKKEIKPTFPKREMLFTAGIQEHYKTGLSLILTFKQVQRRRKVPSL